MPISSIIGEKCGPRSVTEFSEDKSWLKTSNSSSESVTSTTFSSSEFLVQDGVAIPINCCDEEASTFGLPFGIEVELQVPSVVGPGKRTGYVEKVPSGIGVPSGRRNPSTATLMRRRRGS